ncbi:MAG: hypothetical protein ACYTDT_04490 [Planctomycetota bacterium]|jgi:hypothetical protein
MRTFIALTVCLFVFSACSSTPDGQNYRTPENVVIHDLAEVDDVTKRHFHEYLEAGEHEVVLVVVNMAEKRKDSSVTLHVVDENGKRWPVAKRHVLREHVSVRNFVDAESVQDRGAGLLAAVRIPGDSAKISVVEERGNQSELLGYAAHSTSKISVQRSVVLVLLHDDKVEIKTYE